MSLFGELKRRNVFRVATAYVVVCWLVIQVSDAVPDMIGAPGRVGQALLALLAIGLVVAVVLEWLFEVTLEGIRRDDGSEIAGAGARADRFNIVTIGAVVLLVATFIWQQVSGPKQATDDAGAENVPATINAEDKSIAVLPYMAISADQDDAYFGKGIAEELLKPYVRQRAEIAKGEDYRPTFAT